jgi:hypothetical protein
MWEYGLGLFLKVLLKVKHRVISKHYNTYVTLGEKTGERP